jgi:hypothetical protein
MGICKRVWRKVGTWAVLGGLGAGGVWLAAQAGPEARGQSAASAPANVRRDKIYTNKNLFHLPVQIDAKTRGTLREVRLYVKIGAADWVLQETGHPGITHFSYRTGPDGEYWFSVVTVDRNGRQTPPDVRQEGPGLMVVVDTQEPNLDLQAVAVGGETLLRCAMQDPHPDLSTVRIVYRGNDQMDHIVEPLANQPGYFRVPAEAWNSPVLVKGADRCGNPAVREFQLRNPQLAKQATPPANPPAPAMPDRLPNLPNEESPLTNQPDNVVNVGLKNEAPASVKTTPAGEPSPMPGAVESPAKTIDPLPATPNGPATNPPPPNAPAPFPEAVMPAPLPPPLPSTSTGPDLASSKVFGPNNAAGPRQILNTTKAALDYRIDHVGPSGVGKVEVYCTTDQGSTWQRLAEDADRRSPAEINLPGEGVYGLKLIVTNGNGFGGTPPKPGEAPTSYIEVDMTAPIVQLREIEPNAKDGCLEIRWKAIDKNLGGEPIDLYFRVRHDAPWVPIAKKLRNEGIYLWSFPRDCGNRFFVKIEVTDQAGNIARVECANPVVLDMTEPRASVVGISGMTVQPVLHKE